MKPKTFRNYCGVDAENAGYEPDGMFDFSGGGNLTEDADGYDELQEFLSDADDVNFSADGAPADVMNDPIGTRYKVLEKYRNPTTRIGVRKGQLIRKDSDVDDFIELKLKKQDSDYGYSITNIPVSKIKSYIESGDINTVGSILKLNNNVFGDKHADKIIEVVAPAYKGLKYAGGGLMITPELNSKLEKVVYGNSSSGMPPINNRRPPINNPAYTMSIEEQEKVLKDVPLGDYIVNVRYIRSYPADATSSKKSTQFFKGDTISVVDKKMLPSSGWLKGGFLVLSNGELVSLYNYNKQYIQKK